MRFSRTARLAFSRSRSRFPRGSPGRHHHGDHDRRLRPRIAPAGDPRLERVRGHPGHDRVRHPGRRGPYDRPGLGASDDHGSGRDRRVDAARVRRRSVDRARRHQRRRLHARSQHHGRRQHRARPGHQPVQRLRDHLLHGRREHDRRELHRHQCRGHGRSRQRQRRLSLRPFERQHRGRDSAGGPEPDLRQRHGHRPELAGQRGPRKPHRNRRLRPRGGTQRHGHSGRDGRQHDRRTPDAAGLGSRATTPATSSPETQATGSASRRRGTPAPSRATSSGPT